LLRNDHLSIRGAGEGKYERRRQEERKHRTLHVAGVDLLAEILGRSPDHQRADECGYEDKQEPDWAKHFERR
jgi:hypothetical protein